LPGLPGYPDYPLSFLFGQIYANCHHYLLVSLDTPTLRGSSAGMGGKRMHRIMHPP
jgi:hypothetical protein